MVGIEIGGISGKGLASKFLKPDELRAKLEQANYRNLGYAGGDIMRTARRSIKQITVKQSARLRELRRTARTEKQQARLAELRKLSGASEPGTPPHSKTGRLKTSIMFHVDRMGQKVIIGPTHEKIDLIGWVHEFGMPFRGKQYPARPFMGPALREEKPKIAKKWADSVR